MVIPYSVDVPMSRRPIANVVLIAAIIAVTLTYWAQPASDSVLPPEHSLVFDKMTLRNWSPVGLLGHLFLHADILHLLGNMLFLWVFGNAVCAKLGSAAYVALFGVLGMAAGAAQLIISGGPAIGASGAINGIVGMFLVLYPRNDVRCFTTFLFRIWFFSLSSFWLILMWLAFDIWGAVRQGENVAYFAHLGGFAAGFAVMFILVRMRVVQMTEGEQSLVKILHAEGAGPGTVSASEGKRRRADYLARRFARRQESAPTAAASSAIPYPSSPKTDSPATPAVIIFQCKCGRVIKAAAVHAGRQVRCPACKELIRIPNS